ADLDKQAKAAKDEYEARRLTTLATARRKSLEEARLAVEYLRLTKTDAKQAAVKWEALLTFWNDRGDVGLLKPLSPESFALSLLQATGAIDLAEDQARASLAKKKPKEWTDAEPAARPRVEAMLVDKQTFAPLQGNLPQFIAMYGDVSSQEFAASPNQALFFGNSGVVEGLLKPAPGNLTERLTKLSDVSALADELFLA